MASFREAQRNPVLLGFNDKLFYGLLEELAGIFVGKNTVTENFTVPVKLPFYKVCSSKMISF